MYKKTRKRSANASTKNSLTVRLFFHFLHNCQRLILRKGLHSTKAPYSKSHAKRLKAKAKESLTAALGDMDHVLDAIKAGSSGPSPDKATPLSAPGRNVHLTDKQRAKVFETEKSRHSAVLSDPGYQKNPFAAIRKHIQTQTRNSEVSKS